MPDFVLDASITLAWCFEDERTPFSEGILDRLRSGSECLVSTIWPFEVANVLCLAERRGRISPERSNGFLAMLQTQPILIAAAPPQQIFQAVLDLARNQDLTAYDASYLELALRGDLPLATLDNRLQEAAHRCGVPLLEP